jgi:hypothetical protein
MQAPKEQIKREPDNRHTAPYMLVAHIRYISDKTNTIKNKKDIVVARCFTKTEARKFQDAITETKFLKWNIYGVPEINKDDPLNWYNDPASWYKDSAPKIQSQSYVDGELVTEHIVGFSIVPKTKYL